MDAILPARTKSSQVGCQPNPGQTRARYLADWIQILENDNKAIFTAAALAAYAVDFAMNLALTY